MIIKNKLVTELVIAAVMIVAAWAVVVAVFDTPYPFYVVASGSMIPALEVNDILLVQGRDTIEQVQVGDIIVFDRPDGADRVIVHRVTEIVDDEPRVLRTRGDANVASIPGTDFPITGEEYIGKVMYVVPKLGYVTKAIAPPINYILIAGIVAFMIYKQVRASRSGAAQEGPDEDVGDLSDLERDDEYSAGAEPGDAQAEGGDKRPKEGGAADGAPEKDSARGGARDRLEHD